jgi:hypothetical protein
MMILVFFGLAKSWTVAAEPQISASLRFWPEDRGAIIFRVTNVGAVNYDVWLPDAANNDVRVVLPNGKVWARGYSLFTIAQELPPGASYTSVWDISPAEGDSGPYTRGSGDGAGIYLFQWTIERHYTSDVMTASYLSKNFGVNSNVLDPKSQMVGVLAGENALKPRIYIVPVVREDSSPELRLLIVNGTKMSMALADNGQILARSPVPKYQREMPTTKVTGRDVTVESGKVAEWRLPWKTVLDLFTKDEQSKIISAGADLDLVWKVGDLDSPVLPVSLVLRQEGMYKDGVIIR